MDIDLKRQFVAGFEHVNAADRAAVHDAQTLFADRSVGLGRSPVGDGQIIDEQAVKLAIFMSYRVTVL